MATFEQVSAGKIGDRTESRLPGPSDLNAPRAWFPWEKVLFRFFFLYFLIQVVPLDWKYFRDLSSLDWSSFHFSNFFYLARYSPRFFGNVPVLADWLVVAALAAVGTTAWSIVDNKNKEYNQLHYWLRVVIRYRLAAALLAYGFIKFYPMQMPLPSISNLNTNYGDISDWKVFAMSTGIVPGYQSFLGGVEIAAALLLLWRKSAFIGAFLVLPFTGNVVMSNLAYEGGEYVYALYLVSLALFLFAHDVPRLIRLTSLNKITLPEVFKPDLRSSRVRTLRVALKSLFIVAIFVYALQTRHAYYNDPYHYPGTDGLRDAAGLYNVTEFRLDGKEIPYDPAHPVRWRDVVFEKWNTLSVRSNQPVVLATSTTEEISLNDQDRPYEYAGIAGRHYYTYQLDSAQNLLKLKNRNQNHDESMVLRVERPATDRIILSGSTSDNQQLYVVLDKIDKKYLLDEAARQGRRRGLKL